MKPLFSYVLLNLFVFYGSYAGASGSFSPGGGGFIDNRYNLGKAIVSGRLTSVDPCKTCHKKFSRRSLRTLEQKISATIINCEVHDPCYDGALKTEQLEALDAYFTKRYNLR